MPRVTWARREEIAEAFDPIAPKVQGSIKDFRPPPTIEDDFRRLLAHDVPHVNYSFELIRDWYRAQEEGYEPVMIRAQVTPIDWKSKIGNSDMSYNFKVTHDIPIHKGDIVIREDGKIYMLNWNVQVHANNQATQNCECNDCVEFCRKVLDVTDDFGFVVEPEHLEVIVPSIPIIHVEYAGRPDYNTTQWQPGVNSDHLIAVQIQYNNRTKALRANDTFEMDHSTYRIINVSFAQVDINKEYGIIDLYAKRVAGGGLDG